MTLVGEADRKFLRGVIKHSSGEDRIRNRIIPPEVVQTWLEKVESLNGEIADILIEEKEERQVCYPHHVLAMASWKINHAR